MHCFVLGPQGVAPFGQDIALLTQLHSQQAADGESSAAEEEAFPEVRPYLFCSRVEVIPMPITVCAHHSLDCSHQLKHLRDKSRH